MKVTGWNIPDNEGLTNLDISEYVQENWELKRCVDARYSSRRSSTPQGMWNSKLQHITSIWQSLGVLFQR